MIKCKKEYMKKGDGEYIANGERIFGTNLNRELTE